MTLALALRCANGLVLAADSRASSSTSRADSSEKFLQVNRDVGIMTYGLAKPGLKGMQSVVEYVRDHLSTASSMGSITEKAKELIITERDAFLAQYREEIVKAIPDMDPAEVEAMVQALRNEALGFIIGGFDGNDTGLFRIYHSTAEEDFEMFEQENDVLAAQWPLPTILLPYLRYSGISVYQGTRLATILMILTAMHEDTVGGPIHLATVTAAEGFTLLHEREVAVLVESVQPILARMRSSFIDSWLCIPD